MKKANNEKPNESKKPNKVKKEHLEFLPDHEKTENKKGLKNETDDVEYKRRLKR